MDESSTLVGVPDRPMVWHGWGEASRRPGLSARAERVLAGRIGPLGDHRGPVPIDAVRLAESRLDGAAKHALADLVGPTHVSSDRQARIEHAGGRSYPDLLRRRAGDAVDAPDAIVFPASHDEVMGVLAIAVEHGIAVVPFGGGTSVVGGVEPVRGSFASLIAVDLSRMDRTGDVDEDSLLATFGPGVRGPAAETELRRAGYTLGHFPQSYMYASIGGYVATRSAGQASTGYGRIDEMVHAVRIATPSGTLELGGAPATAAGPDLRQLILGSEGLLGIITQATLRIQRAPEVEIYQAHAVTSFDAGTAVLRDLVQEGMPPDVCRLSDPDETFVYTQQTEGAKGRLFRGYLRARGHGSGCLLILGWTGSPTAVKLRRAAAGQVLTAHDTLRLGGAPGRAWAHGRFDGPYLRDELMDRGVMVETLETATTWSNLERLYRAVRQALTHAMTRTGTPGVVLCHVSHIYQTGASLYFTWICRQTEGEEVEQWRAVKQRASQQIIAAGGTITHHHAVGIDHAPYMEAEIGGLGLSVLASAKSVLDPAGVLNPGKLLPSDRDLN